MRHISMSHIPIFNNKCSALKFKTCIDLGIILKQGWQMLANASQAYKSDCSQHAFDGDLDNGICVFNSLEKTCEPCEL